VEDVTLGIEIHLSAVPSPRHCRTSRRVLGISDGWELMIRLESKEESVARIRSRQS
jgi:hypothetical protein